MSKQIHVAEMENKSHVKQILFLRGAQSRSCNNFINRLIISVRPSSYGCTWEVAKHEGEVLESHKAMAKCNPRFSSFPLCSQDIYFIKF